MNFPFTFYKGCTEDNLNVKLKVLMKLKCWLIALMLVSYKYRVTHKKIPILLIL